MNRPAIIIETLGIAALAARLGVEPSRVRRARYEPTLPAAWYAVAYDMAAEGKLTLPDRGAFAFKFGEAAE